MSGIVERLRNATVRFANESNEEAAIRRNQAITEAADEIGRLRRELEEARRALEPFADAADYYSSGVHRPIAEDALPCGPALIVKHLRAARAALRAGEEGR